jgi:hypothetical protein
MDFPLEEPSTDLSCSIFQDHRTPTGTSEQALFGGLPSLTLTPLLSTVQSTIMDYDKIIVLDAGKLIEFDSPQNLLQDKDGKLRALVNDSGDIEALEKLAQGGSKSQ